MRPPSFLIGLLVPLVAACAPAAAPRQVAMPAARPAVIGYLFPRDALIDPASLAADKLTHVNYAFANVRDGRVVDRLCP